MLYSRVHESFNISKVAPSGDMGATKGTIKC